MPNAGGSRILQTGSLRRSLKPTTLKSLDTPTKEISMEAKITGPEPNINFKALQRLGSPDILGDGYELDLEVYKFMMKTEKSEKHPSPHLFDKQTNITHKMRTIVVDWMIEVHRKFKMQTETLYTAVHIMDLYLTEKDLDKSNYQRLASAALLMASKCHERTVPRIEDLVYFAGTSFTADALRKMESTVFECVNWYTTPVLACNILERSLRVINADARTSMFCMFIMDSLLLDHDFIGVRPSFLAALVLYTGLALLNGRCEWTDEITANTGYSESVVKESALKVLYSLTETAKSHHNSLKKKYNCNELSDVNMSDFPVSFN